MIENLQQLRQFVAQTHDRVLGYVHACGLLAQYEAELADLRERAQTLERLDPIIELARKVGFCDDCGCIYARGMQEGRPCLICGERPTEQMLRDLDADTIAKERRERVLAADRREQQC